ncbi:MAG: hypothetical protein M1818_002126 [Claussenomyces sp. TS43310]|nr:MAG: hypothetical protein M1818_002126 [Claussenomyces sp. TS43310]
MKETDSQSYLDRIRSWARSKAYGPSSLSVEKSPSTEFPLSSTQSSTQHGSDATDSSDATHVPHYPSAGLNGTACPSSKSTANNVADNTSGVPPPPAPPPQAEGAGTIISADQPKKKRVMVRFYLTAKAILLSSWVNVLLVFVPIGIAAKVANLSSIVIFAMNAVAIIPLAGLLSHATESVAKKMGDTIGALMNVTFGNAVELIIFIALAKDEISIVQASLLGSILANLLLILGMCFLIGGLRFREQIYNSTVTQMSACLLSLSVMSLLLPVLLLVYGLYLLFQLKSHAYMYESTPQHIIDEEAQPGPIAIYFDSSSSSDDSSSSSDSDSSRGSNTTAARIRRVMRRGRRHRKLSVGSRETTEPPRPVRTPSYAASTGSPIDDVPEGASVVATSALGHRLGAVESASDVEDDLVHTRGSRRESRRQSFTEKHEAKSKRERKHKRRRRKHKTHHVEPIEEKAPETTQDPNEPRRVDFAVIDLESQSAQKKPFSLGGINLRPAISRPFSQTVFSQPPQSGSPHMVTGTPSGPIPRVRYGIRRTNSLPDRLNQNAGSVLPTANSPPIPPVAQIVPEPKVSEDDESISRTTAFVLLLISTGLVALCAEFMVSSINEVTQKTSLGTTFVGLIILPIVGNAAEHVTAVTVASKNKMDLAIGVAVGSSIQIALFVTPLVVLLGWCLDKDMTLYFTLFETVSLFVSAFIVNFLVLDGRSNYLEGALLCAAYVIIAVAAYFYPRANEESVLGGSGQDSNNMLRSFLNLH